MNNAITSPTINEHHLKRVLIHLIQKVYPALPDEFYGHELERAVRIELFRTDYWGKKRPYPDTVLRYFRQLREDGVLKCECVNKSKSIYKKM